MTPQKTNNIEKNTNERLSVQVSLTGLSFLVTNLITSEIDFIFEKQFENTLTPEEILDLIIKITSDQKELQHEFSEVIVIYATNLYTVVPSSLFDETKASEYLKFNSKILANDFIAYDTIDPYQMTIVYVPFVNINNYFFDKYGSFQYYHSGTVLLKSILHHEKNSINIKVYLHILNDTFDIIIIKNNDLKLCNTHSYKTPEDFIYYILFTLEQLNLNPETIEIVLCGDIKEEDDIFKILYHYIRHISFFNPITPKMNSSDNELPHKNYLLKYVL